MLADHTPAALIKYPEFKNRQDAAGVWTAPGGDNFMLDQHV